MNIINTMRHSKTKCTVREKQTNNYNHWFVFPMVTGIYVCVNMLLRYWHFFKGKLNQMFGFLNPNIWLSFPFVSNTLFITKINIELYIYTHIYTHIHI